MALKAGHDWGMRPLLLTLLALVIAQTAYAQTGNWGPSVTSMGFGGSDRPGGVPPSVTSLGFGEGFGRTGSVEPGGHHGFPRPHEGPGEGSRHGDHDYPYYPVYPGWGSYYSYPMFDYGYSYQTPPAVVENPDEYRGGPTIFDRRGDGQYAGPYRSGAAPQPPPPPVAQPAAQPAQEPTKQPETVLIFKDGHQVKVDNYAVLGNTLYDLSGGKRHKIPLADLDLNATARQNDDRGVDFQLPGASSAN